MKITINNIDITQYVTLPISTNLKLDESLDGNVLVLKGTQIKSAFEPLDLVLISYDDGAEERWLVATDACQRQITGKKNFYTHNINLIEETKKLEGEICDTITFTNALSKNPKFSTFAIPQIQDGSQTINALINQAKVFKTPIDKLSPFTVPNPYRFFNVYCSLGVNPLFGEPTCTIETPSTFIEVGTNEDYTFESLEVGSYNIGYMGWVKPKTFGYTAYHVIVNYAISVQENVSIEYRPPRKTISDVINGILRKFKVRNNYESIEYFLNAEQEKLYNDVLAPEFTFTRNNLFETFRMVGGFLHAIPRLKGNELSYTNLSGSQGEDINKDVAFLESQGIDQYCDRIDCNVNNLVNNENNENGLIVEPNPLGYMTPRTEEGQVIIQDNSVIIKTKYPIQKIISISANAKATDSSGTEHIILDDLEPFTYEKYKYDLLSSYSAGSNSKAYALYYTQGQKNIYGMNFQVQDTSLPAVFKNFAIQNIINLLAFKQGWTAKNINLEDFLVRITYIPIISTRCVQHKPYIGQSKNDRAINYNQAENLIESKPFGENLKGVVSRLGNKDDKKTFIFKSINQVPSLGKVVDNKYISEINIERYKNHIKCDVSYSQDFNRWSQYVGVKSNLRQYEISEKMVYDRYCLYEDFLVIGEKPTVLPTAENKPLLTKGGLGNLSDILNDYSTAYTISNARIGIDETANGYAKKYLSLPVLKYSIGNSIVFTFEMEDNFKAGSQSLTTSGNVDKSGNQRIMQGVNYGDDYGEFTSFKLNLVVWDELGSLTDDEKIAFANKLPLVDGIDPNIDTSVFGFENKVFSTDEMSLYVYKDNREAIKFCYQINCITNKPNVIIGKKMSSLFVDYTGKIKGYILDRPIMKFEEKIDVSNLTAFYDIEKWVKDETNMSLSLPSKTANKQGKSLVFVDSNTNELFWGENIDINIGDTITPSVISFRHKKRI